MKWFIALLALCFSLTLGAQDSITLLFVGDLMQHQAQIDAARTEDGGFDYAACFSHVKQEIGRADLAIGNLEVPFGGKPYRGYPAFSAPDEYLYAMQEAGFDVLLTANNHCLDRGKRGLERTVRLLDSLQISYAGTYPDRETRDKHYPLLVEKNGFRIAFLNYTYGTNGIEASGPNVVNYIDRKQMEEDIRAARRMMPDALIACMHWGVEYRSLPERAERELADWLLSQGVDHVIGTHPHVIQPMEIKQDSDSPAKHVVAYSLGNFISNMSKEHTDGGAMLKLRLQRAFGITRLADCRYSLVWTSRPAVNGKGRFELYPASLIGKPMTDEECRLMTRFLDASRRLLDAHNRGVEEYVFE